MSELIPIKNEFNISKCNTNDYLAILDCLSYLEPYGDKKLINIFRELKAQFERSCPLVVRQLNGSLSNKPPTPITIPQGFTAMLEYAFSAPAPVERKFPPNLEESYRENRFPQKCTPICEHRTCPYHNDHHYGEVCEMQFKKFENESFHQSLIKPKNPNEELLR